MRALVALLLAAPLLGGCVAPKDAAPPAVDARIVSLAIAPACAPAGSTLTVRLGVENPEPRNGTARVVVYAQQYGNLVDASERLGPRESRILTYSATIDTPGRTTAFAVGPLAQAPQVALVATDPLAGQGPRC